MFYGAAVDLVPALAQDQRLPSPHVEEGRGGRLRITRFNQAYALMERESSVYVFSVDRFESKVGPYLVE